MRAVSLLQRPVAVGRSGEQKSAGSVIAIALRMTRDDVLEALRYYYVVKFAGARLVPRPLRYALYRSAGMRTQRRPTRGYCRSSTTRTGSAACARPRR